MMAVPEFGRSLLRKAQAPAGHIKTYIEVPIRVEQKRGFRPDGAIILSRGTKSWKALVEVKTGTRELEVSQIETYLDLAKDNGFDAVITISSQLTAALVNHPLIIDKKKIKKVALYHWSWVEVLSEAIIQREHRGIRDTDQEWILGELISYLEHENSGALQFHDMGSNWASIRDGARDASLRGGDGGVADIADRWDQFMQYLCLFLGRELGVKITQVLSKKEQADPSSRASYLIDQLVHSGSLDGVLRIPRAVGDVNVLASLRGRTVIASITVPAPADKRNQTRVNWLLKQLERTTCPLRIEAQLSGSRSTVIARLSDLREDSTRLLPSDRNHHIKSFIVSLTDEMGTKRSGNRGSFIGEASDLVLRFYREVVQEIKPWAAAPAKLPTSRDDDDIGRPEPDSVVEQRAREQTEEIAQANPVTPQ